MKSVFLKFAIRFGSSQQLETKKQDMSVSCNKNIHVCVHVVPIWKISVLQRMTFIVLVTFFLDMINFVSVVTCYEVERIKRVTIFSITSKLVCWKDFLFGLLILLWCSYVQVVKTIWDWELINTNKPIWSRKPKDVKDEEYNEFYKSFTKVNLAASKPCLWIIFLLSSC